MAAHALGIAQSRRTRHGTNQETNHLKVVDIQHLIGHKTHQNQGDHRDQCTIHYPHITAIQNGADKAIADTQSDCRQEERQTHLAKHHIGTRCGESDHVIVRTKTADQQRYDQRTTRQSQFERLVHTRNSDRQRAQQHTQENTKENRHQVGQVKALQLVAKNVRHLAYILFITYHHDTVA